jgi:hypothetical protein
VKREEGNEKDSEEAIEFEDLQNYKRYPKIN